MIDRNNLPLVTVRTLVFNNGKFIIQTLESVKNQTYPKEKIQHIIVDDCSEDNSVELVEKWIKSNGYECTFIKHKENWGICKTINQTLSISKGEYICGTGDDIWMPEKIERQVIDFESSPREVGVVFSDAFLVDENLNPLYGWFIQRHRDFTRIPQGDIFESLLEGNFIPSITAMVKKEVFDVVGTYDESLKYEDYDMWLRIAREYKFAFSDYVSAKYRLHNKNFHKKLKSHWDLEKIKIYNKHLDHPKARDKIGEIILRLYRSGQLFDPTTYAMVREFIPYLKGEKIQWAITNKVPFKYYNLGKAFKIALRFK